MKIDEKIEFEEFDDYDEAAHKRLLQNVSSVTRTQHIKKATRSEPSLKTSEFHLSKTSNAATSDEQQLTHNSTGQVTVQDLLKIFKKTNKHTELGKTLLKTQRVKKRLEKPLEKIHAEKIQRAVGYEKTKTQLNRWDAIVAKNAMAEQLVFPLQDAGDGLEIKTPKTLENFRVKSDLMLKMEALMPEKEPAEEEPSEFALSVDEIKEKAKELAKIRMRESFKMAKGRRQNKIKSKKFHRLMKRDKVKQQLKEFEELQKSDPDAALKKLEQIEHQRALERTSLRHKNTGSWAQNLQVRAKYDENARKELAEQLTISRELTQKQLVESDSAESEKEDEDEEDEQPRTLAKDTNNPWMKAQLKPSGQEDIASFVSGYRKYWNERNQNEQALEDYKSLQVAEVAQEVQDSDASSSEDEDDESNLVAFKANLTNGFTEEDMDDDLADMYSESSDDEEDSSDPASAIDDKTIENIFEDVEENIERKIARKLKKIQQDLVDDEKDDDSDAGKGKAAKWKQDLSFKKSAKRPMLDEELNDFTGNAGDLEALKQKIGQHEPKKAKTPAQGLPEDINPEQFVQIKAKHLMSALPDEIANMDEDEEDDAKEASTRKMTIAEAFEDDDIVADFEQEKQDETEKNKPKDIDLSLPGWGSWGGTGLENRKRNTNKKFIIKVPDDVGRKDQKKDRVIINEDPNDKMKEHLVRDLPFPFTSVKDYEASIRAPIGRTFVPETAHRLLTKPAVVTKMGQIIRPMDESMLVQKKKVRGFTKTGKKVAELEKGEDDRKNSVRKR